MKTASQCFGDEDIKDKIIYIWLNFSLQKTLRHQDVTLMRQFITMNDTIRSISKDQRSEKTRKKRLRNKTLVLNASLNQTMPSWQIPLIRQQSVPRFCDVIPEVRERTWSCSSGGKVKYIIFFVNLKALTKHVALYIYI